MSVSQRPNGSKPPTHTGDIRAMTSLYGKVRIQCHIFCHSFKDPENFFHLFTTIFKILFKIRRKSIFFAKLFFVLTDLYELPPHKLRPKKL